MNNFDLLNEIVAPELNSSTYAADIAEVFENIDDNFKKILSAQIAKGADGKDVSIMSVPLWDENSALTEIGSKLLQAIYYDCSASIASGDTYSTVENTVTAEYGAEAFGQFNPSSTIEMFVIIEDDGSFTLAGVAQYYFFIDHRLNNLSTANTTFVDLSGIFYYDVESETFKNSYMLPTIYYNSVKGTFCWVINGEKTSINATGVKGADGDSSAFYVCSGEIESQTQTVYKIKITNVQDDNGDWVDAANTEIGQSINELVGVYFDVDASTTLFAISTIADNSGTYPYVYVIKGMELNNIISGLNLKQSLLEIHPNAYLQTLFIPSDSGKCHTIKNSSNNDILLQHSTDEDGDSSADKRTINIINYDVDLKGNDIKNADSITANNITANYNITANTINATTINCPANSSMDITSAEIDNLTVTTINNKSIYDILNYLVPSGVIVMWSGTTPPTGWAICNGSNGTPNLSGKFIVGWNQNDSDFTPIGNKTKGEKTHILTTTEMPSHSHSVTVANIIYDKSKMNGAVNEYRVSISEPTKSISSGSKGSGSPHNNLPPYYVLAYIMKL